MIALVRAGVVEHAAGVVEDAADVDAAGDQVSSRGLDVGDDEHQRGDWLLR